MKKLCAFLIAFLLVAISVLPAHAVSLTTVVDSYTYDPVPQNSKVLGGLYPSGGSNNEIGQTFTVPSSSNYLLKSTMFYIFRHTGSGSGSNMVAVLYAITGSYGTTSKPTGSALAISDLVDRGSLTQGTWVLVTFTFSGSNQYNMLSGTHYAIMLRAQDGAWDTSTNFVNISVSVPGTASGNECYFNSGAYFADVTFDSYFIIRGDPPAPSTFVGIAFMSLVTVGLVVGAAKSYESGNTENVKPLVVLAVASAIALVILVAAGI